MLTYLFLFVGAVVCVIVAAMMLVGRRSSTEKQENVVRFPAGKRRERLG